MIKITAGRQTVTQPSEDSDKNTILINNKQKIKIAFIHNSQTHISVRGMGRSQEDSWTEERPENNIHRIKFLLSLGGSEKGWAEGWGSCPRLRIGGKMEHKTCEETTMTQLRRTFIISFANQSHERGATSKRFS